MLHISVGEEMRTLLGSDGLMRAYPAEHHGIIARDGETLIRIRAGVASTFNRA